MHSIKHIDEGDKGVLVLAGSFGVEQAAALKEALLELASGHRETAVDLSGVQEADLTLLQLLCATQKTLSQTGRSLACASEVPAILLDIARRAGMAQDGEPMFWKRKRL
ncbi:MAG: STAS domain-containing protein [Desulfovibrionaceae bacterium]|nr:STAS domain-containing protein [Desulfovibrionaceae bacterium]